MSFVSGPVVPSANVVTSAMIVDGTVTLADQANVTPPTLIGRGTSGAGVEEALTPTNLLFGNSTVAVSAPTYYNPFAYTAMDYDPLVAGTTATVTMAAATVYFAKIPLPGSGTTIYSITNVVAYLGVKATSSLTNSYAGLVTSGGVLIGESADESSANQNWSSTGAAGLKTHALVGGPFNVTPTGLTDFVYACLYIGTTAGTGPIWQAAFAGTAPVAFLNSGLAAAASRQGTLAVANTSTPFTGMTLSSITATAVPIWMAIN